MSETKIAREKDNQTQIRGRKARLRQRTKLEINTFPTLVRKIKPYEIISQDELEAIHQNTLDLLENHGIDFRDEDALKEWKKVGADVKEQRVKIDRNLLMTLIDKVPSEYVMRARDPKKSVKVGNENTIFVPTYGSPYVRALDNERRYGTLKDLYDLHKLAYMIPQLHSSGSLTCEPVDIPVPHRHLHIVYGLLRYSDKPFMGIVTAKERAEDTVKMAKIVFGEKFVQNNPVMTSVVNCNSPLVWDKTMLDALRIYAKNNQPVNISPFVLAGASSPTSIPAAIVQLNAEALAGLAFTQIINPGCPMLYGQFVVTTNMKTGAPMGGTPEVAHMQFIVGQLARKYNVPWRTSGSSVGAKIPDIQAGYEANMMMHAAILAGANYIFHSAGWLEAGLTASFAKFTLDAEQLDAWYRYAQGIKMEDFNVAAQTIRDVGPGGHFFGTQHTLDNFETAFFAPELMDFNSFEQWHAEGEKNTEQKGYEKAKFLLDHYQDPGLDPAIDEHLKEFIKKEKKKFPLKYHNLIFHIVLPNNKN